MNAPYLSLQTATIGYPQSPILEQLQLDISPGEAIAIVGPNGSGKTALLKTLAGILTPLEGAVQRSVQHDGDLRIGYVPQRATVSGLLPLTVDEVIRMGTFGMLQPWQAINRRQLDQVQWAIQELNLVGLEQKWYAELSGGQQQRVLLARALASHPQVLVLDEPLASLDTRTFSIVLRVLETLAAAPTVALVWADHFVPEMLQVVHQVCMIQNKRLIRLSVQEYEQHARETRQVQGSHTHE